MTYEFEVPVKGIHFDVRCNVRDLNEITGILEHGGCRRVFTAPQIVSVPGYYEAYQESEAEAAADDRQRAVDKDAAVKRLADAVRAEM